MLLVVKEIKFNFLNDFFIIFFLFFYLICVWIDFSVWFGSVLCFLGWSCFVVVKYWSVYWGVIVSVWGVGGVLVF